jgi:hypothetical protein
MATLLVVEDDPITRSSIDNHVVLARIQEALGG